jgi:hypothetical protein
MSSSRIIQLSTGLAIAVTLALPLPAAGADGPDQRCFAAKAGKRKTSLGVHQWTARQEVRWCAERRAGRWRIASAQRRVSVRTATNWRLLSRGGEIRRRGARAVAESRFHFRLRYPYFEQNCYPRLEVKIWPSGKWTRSVATGC